MGNACSATAASGAIDLSPANDALFALWLVVPAKPFDEGKSRLAATLSGAERASLSRRWLTHVLNVAQAWGRFANIAVISRDTEVLALASALGALPIPESTAAESIAAESIASGDELNKALRQGCRVAQQGGAEGVLVLPADLPLLTHTDLDELYELALEGDSMIIAPSRDGGTNALLLRPPHAIDYAFGEQSFARHLSLATAARLPVHVYTSATLALDVDRPEDLRLALEMPQAFDNPS
jgi:2-phospho-L-lactate guanylyltransferase